MATFKVLAGGHVVPDPSQPPRKVPNPDGTVAERPVTRTALPGETVESDTDLVARHGAEKFALVGGTPGQPSGPAAGPAVFPGGQVSSGLQRAASGVRPGEPPQPGSPLSGPLPPEHYERAGVAGAGAAPAPGQAPGQAAGQPADDESGDGLEERTVAQLHELAAREKTPLHGAKTKDEVVKAIRASRKK
jgi:hypothetical protein